MSGIAYRRLFVDLTDSFKRSAFKPSTTFKADPVPASNPQLIQSDYKYRPGHQISDPVPARRASETFDIPSFTAIDDMDDFIGPDPIPARNFWEE